MKKTVFLNYALGHLFMMAFGGALSAAAVFSSSAAISPLWSLSAPVTALAAYGIGRHLRVDDGMPDGKTCWDAATYLYLTELALLALLWRMSAAKAALGANVWNLSCAPALVGLDAWIGHIHTAVTERGYTLLYRTENYKNLILPLMGVFAAAIEPLCLTLGFLSGKAADGKEPAETDTPAQSENDETIREEQ